MTIARQRKTVELRQVPWERSIGTGCACDHRAPCLLHFDDTLDWRARALTYQLIGINPSPGR
jgi:hypothetical protein